MITSFSGDYRFLSNFYWEPMTINGIVFNTNEHFFQARKMINDQDFETVRLARMPALAKRLARSLPKREDWDEVKEHIMLIGLREKFSHAYMRMRLLETGDQHLVEGNTWNDTYWGICNGKGQNRLGELLMRVRKDLQNV